VAGVAVERADALFQREQRLVDLGALDARLAVVVERVRAALAAGEVDERQAADLKGSRVAGGGVECEAEAEVRRDVHCTQA